MNLNSPAPAETPRFGRWDAPRTAFLAAMLIMGAASVALRGDATPDVSWLITMCERMLNGERTYNAWGGGHAQGAGAAPSLAKVSYPILGYPSRPIP